jgi:hypothetical protein
VAVRVTLVDNVLLLLLLFQDELSNAVAPRSKMTMGIFAEQQCVVVVVVAVAAAVFVVVVDVATADVDLWNETWRVAQIFKRDVDDIPGVN